MNTDSRVGTMRTVAGSGTAGLSGDGGPATAACLNEPKGLCLDRQGHLLIADSENHVIRKVDRLSGVIVTVAGSSAMPDAYEMTIDQVTSDASDDPFNEGTATAERAFAQQADLSGTVRYVVNGAGMIKRFGGDEGPAVRALLNFPTAIAVDADGRKSKQQLVASFVQKAGAKTVLDLGANAGEYARVSRDAVLS